MNTLQQNIASALDGIFSHRQISDKDKSILSTIKQEVSKMPSTEKCAFVDHLLSRPLPTDNPVVLHFYLYDCFLDVRFLDALLPFLPQICSVNQFYEIYWNFSQRLFTAKQGSVAVQAYLRHQVAVLGNTLRQFLLSKNVLNRASKLGLPNVIAILSPQILNMRHSPTREAFSIALHLQRYCGCTCYVFNTNSMIYEGDNNLHLLSYSKYNANEELSGAQTVKVDYLDFSDDVNVISFEKGNMTTQKIAGVMDALKQLKVDAVIAHGENLLIGDAVYGILPSLFATTGSVVPYNHCDAYFVPANLLSNSSKQTAEKYGHTGEFMPESMLSTPEGVAQHAKNRGLWQLPDDAWLYLVVGTRLNDELTEEFVDFLRRLLEAQADSHILFAGTPKLELGRFFNSSVKKRVHNLGFQDDLPAISAMCQVYLNPKRNGGGTSAQTAIINGLPVVTLDYGHISAIVPPDRRLVNFDAAFDYTKKLRDAAFYKDEILLYQHHFTENGNAREQIECIYDKLCEIGLSFH